MIPQPHTSKQQHMNTTTPDEKEPSISECLGYAERFANRVIAEGSDDNAINVADAVKWLCGAVRKMNCPGQASGVQSSLIKSIKETHAKIFPAAEINPQYILVSFRDAGMSLSELAAMFATDTAAIEQILREAVAKQSEELVQLRSKQ